MNGKRGKTVGFQNRIGDTDQIFAIFIQHLLFLPFPGIPRYLRSFKISSAVNGLTWPLRLLPQSEETNGPSPV